MKRRKFLLAAGALAAPFGAVGQSTGVPRVGVVHYSSNRCTAQEIGLAVPPAMLVRFDRVIE